MEMDLWRMLSLDVASGFSALDLAGGLIVCLGAIWFGASLAKKQTRAFSTLQHPAMEKPTPGEGHLPGVNFFDYGDMRFLHLASPAVQGSMKISKPFEIHLDYQQRMMAWLLLADLDRVCDQHVMQLGLGAASLTKFCHRQLNTQTTAVELNPQVISTCRQWFHLPADDDKLQVLLADAADVARQATWHGHIDVLQVDLYDQEAACPVLDSEDFYRDCRDLLRLEGCMVVNLFGQACNTDESLKRITAAFGADGVWCFKPTAAGNTVVLAWRQPRLFDKSALQSQAQAIEARWPLPATKWLKVLAPVM